VVSLQVRLEQARYAIGLGMNQRRACKLTNVARLGLVYECKMRVEDGPMIRAVRDYSAQHRRYGARRVRIFLCRDGIVLGRDQTARSWAADFVFDGLRQWRRTKVPDND
jgi:putative transposase